MNKNKGFTLIELLVVIAIIVILASIVLVGIQSATKKAKDARIIANISQIRTQAEILFSSATNGYTDLATQAEVVKLVNDIKDQLTDTNDKTLVNTYGSSGVYCAYSVLNEKDTDGTSRLYQCIDSTGIAAKVKAADLTCNGTVYTCKAATP